MSLTTPIEDPSMRGRTWFSKIKPRKTPLDMNQGKIIEYIDHGRFVCALCLQDNGNRLHLLTTSNREVNLSPKRAAIISGSAIDTLKPREDLLERLKQTEKTRDSLKKQVDVKELSELVRDEKESFDHKYLAQLVFGESITDDHLSALVRALFEDSLYFKMKDGRFLANSGERIDQIIRQREEEARREETLKQGSLWVAAIHQGKTSDDPPCKEDIVNLLVELALHGSEGPNFKYGKELLTRAGISDIRKAMDLLVKLGVWDEDENLDLLRLGIKADFTEKQTEASACLAGAKIDLGEGREDLRDLPTLTIDGPLTRDYDDAVSLETAGDILHLGIHIADVSAVISPDSELDREAKDRASSHYFPRGEIPMIPPNLSWDTLSLKQGCDRRAISLFADFDKKGTLLEYRFVPSLIRVQRRLTYEEVDGALSEEGLFQEMHRLSQSLRHKRMNQGALSLSLPDVQVRFNDDSSIFLELVDQNTPSRVIIAEFMILYNCLAARFCRDNQIPALFRTQSEPNETFSEEETGHVYYVFRQRRKLRPLLIDTSPAPHTVLGLDAYTQVTSPIRRYLDLVAQRQISSFLMGSETVYDNKGLEEIRMSVQPLIRDLARVKQNRQRYWTLKFLGRNPGEKYTAIVLEELKNKYRVIINDFLLLAEIKKRAGIILKTGEEIIVEVKKANPQEDILELAYA